MLTLTIILIVSLVVILIKHEINVKKEQNDHLEFKRWMKIKHLMAKGISFEKAVKQVKENECEKKTHKEIYTGTATIY